ncbi:MAG: LCP family protein [Actinomycetota bacterium]
MNPFLGQHRLTNYRRSWGQRLVIVFNVTLIIASLSAAGLLHYAGGRASSINRVALDRSLTELGTDQPGERVINILLVGSDSSANLDPDDPIQIGRQGERLGDVIIVAHLDERTGSAALLSLPRDLWVPIAGSERSDRINRAFVVGGAASLIDTIEENLDIPIHHYVNVDFAGFQGLVEALGTVEVQFDTPVRDWNVNATPRPRSQTGFLVREPGCHSLDAEQALAYVRSRYYQTQNADGDWVTDPTSDLGRIRRQQEFLQQLLQKAIDQGARNPLVLSDLIDTGIQNVAIDHELTPALLLEISSTYRSFEPGQLQTYTFPVVDGTVGANRVLLPMEAEAEPLLELFRGASFDDPDTVSVEVVYDPEAYPAPEGPARLPAGVLDVVEVLEDSGFEVAEVGEASLPEGTEVRHSRDGAEAARLVMAALDTGSGAPLTVEHGVLSGRNVVVAVGAPNPTASGVGGVGGDEVAAPAWDHLGSDDSSVTAAPITGDGTPAATADVKGVPAPEGPTEPAPDQEEPAFPAAVTGPPHSSCG